MIKYKCKTYENEVHWNLHCQLLKHKLLKHIKSIIDKIKT